MFKKNLLHFSKTFQDISTLENAISLMITHVDQNIKFERITGLLDKIKIACSNDREYIDEQNF